MKWTYKGHIYNRLGRQMHSFFYTFFGFDVCWHSSQITPYYLKLYFAVGVFL